MILWAYSIRPYEKNNKNKMETKLKEPQMHLHKNHYFELPKAAVIAFMGAIFIAIFGGIIRLFCSDN